MGKLTESIFDGKTCVIPMADVQHFEKHWFGGDERTADNFRGILIITKHTRWDMEADTWANNIYLARDEADAFIESFKVYRFELERETIEDISH